MEDTDYYIIAAVILLILFIIALYVLYMKRRRSSVYAYHSPKQTIDWKGFKRSQSS